MSEYIPKDVTSILGIVDTYIRWRQVEDQDKRSYAHYHPSEFGKCLRRAQYKHYADLGLIESEPQAFDSQKLRLFGKGHNMHARWQRYFTGAGVLRGVWQCSNWQCRKEYGREERLGVFKPEKCECGCGHFHYNEVHVSDETLNFKGNADLILDFSNLDAKRFSGVRVAFNKDHLPDGPVVADMKTSNQNQFRDRVKGSGPHPEYIIQLLIYIHILDCEYGLIIYENKNNSDVACFKIERDEKKFELIKEQVTKLNQMVAEKYLPPPRPLTKADYECKYCEFSPLCHKSSVWNMPDLEKIRKDFYKDLL
jgi:hypothetical protein|tara:strand:+ start:4855 stop:5781 length:927 start_codon:yes stop_codon:yes gene_type:complete